MQTYYTNNTSTLLQRFAYDAWGKRSFITNNIGINNFLFDRGYTGHEHLDQFALINMNGRLYDPILGRMLSPDNFAQNSTQGLNRYSYAMNNPLKYTDPSGNSLEGIFDFFTMPLFFPAKLMTEGTTYINDKINGYNRPGSYFSYGYLFGNEESYYGNNYEPSLYINRYKGTGDFSWRDNLSESEMAWTDYSWQDEYADFWMYVRKSAVSDNLSQSVGGIGQNTNPPSKDSYFYHYFVTKSGAINYMDKNANADNKEMFAWVTSLNSVIVGPWYSATQTSVSKYANRGFKNGIVLFKSTSFKVIERWHTHLSKFVCNENNSYGLSKNDKINAGYYSKWNIDSYILYNKQLILYNKNGIVPYYTLPEVIFNQKK